MFDRHRLKANCGFSEHYIQELKAGIENKAKELGLVWHSGDSHTFMQIRTDRYCGKVGEVADLCRVSADRLYRICKNENCPEDHIDYLWELAVKGKSMPWDNINY